MSVSSETESFFSLYSLPDEFLSEEECFAKLKTCVQQAGNWALETFKARYHLESMLSSWDSTCSSLDSQEIVNLQTGATNAAYQARMQYETTIFIMNNLFEHGVSVINQSLKNRITITNFGFSIQMQPDLLTSFTRVWRSSTRAQKEAKKAMCATVDLLKIIEEFETEDSDAEYIPR